MRLPRMDAQRARWRVALAAAVVIVVAGGAGIATVVSSLHGDDRDDPPAVAVPAEYRAPIAEAAGSCPALTPARLAGQLMAESRFVADAVNDRGGRGLAGLTDDTWRAWQPWKGADRLDAKANVEALAHYLCHLAGQVDAAKIEGEQWRLAVAAVRSGPAAVLAARSLPDDARGYVKRVERYAAWYERNTTFSNPALLAADADETTVATPSAGSTSSPKASAARRTDASASPRAEGTPSPKAPATRRSATPAAPEQANTLSKGNSLFNDEYHGCLAAYRLRDGMPVVVTACVDSGVQRWQPRSDGTIRLLDSTLCMDAAGGATANFTVVQVAHCSGNLAQQFRLRGKQLYSSYADKCVNINYVQGRGPEVGLYSCLDQGNQHFRMR